jgi:hypothetical protein
MYAGLGRVQKKATSLRNSVGGWRIKRQPVPQSPRILGTTEQAFKPDPDYGITENP